MYQSLSFSRSWFTFLFSAVWILTGYSQPQQAFSQQNEAAISAQPRQQPLVVFLVRHAEKVDDSQDSELSTGGKARADQLAKVLSGCDIQHVHSTDFHRTKNTAKPTADLFGLEIETYDAENLPATAEQMRSVGGRHLVVGHSNTVPSMVTSLGGDPGLAIAEGEFDRLYVVLIDQGGNTTSLPMRYGSFFVAPAGGQ